VAINDKFAIYLNCYQTGQASPIRDHNGSSCWAKVLEGELLDTKYKFCDSKLSQCKSTVMASDSVTYLAGTTIHRTENNSEEIVYILLVYSPPFTNYHLYSPNGDKQLTVFSDYHVHDHHT
jgi:cysteine dioxygenase